MMAGAYKPFAPEVFVDPEFATQETPLVDDVKTYPVARRPATLRIAGVAGTILGLVVFACVAANYSGTNNSPDEAQVVDTIGRSHFGPADSEGGPQQNGDNTTMINYLAGPKDCSDHKTYGDCSDPCHWSDGKCTPNDLPACSSATSAKDCKAAGYCKWTPPCFQNDEVPSCQISCEQSLRDLLGSYLVHCSEGGCKIGYSEFCPRKPVTLEKIAAACPGSELTELLLNECQVTGDIEGLSSLTNLEVLSLSGTDVTGDIKDVSSLTKLSYLHLDRTKVTGDMKGLSSLTNLHYLQLWSTDVTGEHRDLCRDLPFTVPVCVI